MRNRSIYPKMTSTPWLIGKTRRTEMTDLISRQALLKELPHANWGKEWDEALAKAPVVIPAERSEDGET